MFGAAAVALAVAAPATMPPVDQCRKDRTFVPVRRALETAVATRSMDRLLSLMADDVRVSFGGRYGKQQFQQYWESRPPLATELWAELDDALKLGCAVKGDARVFPSMFGQADGLDGFETWIARPGARMRATPSLKGSIVARLNWHVLQENGAWDGGAWIPVRLPGGRSGYVHQSAARSPIDYRLVLQKRGRGWRITAFVAGD